MEFNNNIDLNLYKIFYCVAKTGSFSKAAEKLFVSQPSISYAIKNLEEALRTKLFLRVSKGVELTTEGRNLMFYVESAYNSLSLGEKILSSNSNNLEFGEISLGTPSHIGLFFLAKYISNFHRRFPNIKIKVFNTSTTKLVELMEMHKIDLIIDTMPILGKYRKINIKALKEFEYCFAVSKNFKEIEIKEKVSVEELAKLPLMLPQKENKNRNVLDLFFSNKNLSVNPIIEVSNTEMMIDFTRRGMGVGYFIKDSIRDYLEKGSFIEVNIKEELPIEKVAVAYIEDSLNVVSKKFLDLFEEYRVNS